MPDEPVYFDVTLLLPANSVPYVDNDSGNNRLAAGYSHEFELPFVPDIGDEIKLGDVTMAVTKRTIDVQGNILICECVFLTAYFNQGDTETWLSGKGFTTI